VQQSAEQQACGACANDADLGAYGCLVHLHSIGGFSPDRTCAKRYLFNSR
jgi:hypothetical protein